jgi:hypothetical protein
MSLKPSAPEQVQSRAPLLTVVNHDRALSSDDHCIEKCMVVWCMVVWCMVYGVWCMVVYGGMVYK